MVKVLYDAGKCEDKEDEKLLDPFDALNAAFSSMKVTQNEAAVAAGFTKQALSTKMVNRTMKVQDWVRILDSIGVDVAIINKKNGKQIRLLNGTKSTSDRVKGISDGIKFDTENADFLASSFYADGKNEYTDGIAEELYVDTSNNYFLVYHYEEDEKKPKIRVVSKNVADAFVEKYGKTT